VGRTAENTVGSILVFSAGDGKLFSCSPSSFDNASARGLWFTVILLSVPVGQHPLYGSFSHLPQGQQDRLFLRFGSKFSLFP